MTQKLLTLSTSSVQSRLALCAAALAGTAAALPTAEAVVITNNVNMPVPQTFAGFYLNFLTGVFGTAGGTTPGWDWNPYSSASGLGFYWNNTAPNNSDGVSTGPGSSVYADLAIGTVVSGASNFTAAIQGTNPTYRTAGTHILGFQFLNEATGVLNFGYATIQTSGGTGFPATLLSYSYENNGGAITVVPEPSSVALLSIASLALGALGLRAWRKQRAA